MSRFQAVFFDADDTLFDFQQAEHNALVAFLKEEYQLEPTPDLLALYRQINQDLWRQYERQEITRETLVSTRFARFFEAIGRKEDGVAANGRYLNRLARQSCLMPGALELCQRLAPRLPLYILTNGISRVQRSRLAASPLKPLISGIFVSEELGCPKPHRAFFDGVFRALAPLRAPQALMVGDSLLTDIQGAQNAGISACWFHSPAAPLPQGVQPDFSVTSLAQVEDLL